MKFDDRKYFLNRELSWLSFNNRVLEEAIDRNNPILERLKFLAITGSNLDEFFMIRVAGLKEQVNAGYSGKDPSGLTAKEQLRMISEEVHSMGKKQYNTLNRSIIPGLKKHKIFFPNIKELNKKQEEFIDGYFKSTVFPVITPMAIDQSRPFPLLPNKSLNQAVLLESEDKQELFAMVQVPSILPRYIRIPSKLDETILIPMEKIIKKHMHTLFNGFKIIAVNPFRITRNADLSFDEEEAQDLLEEIQKSLIQRKRGFPVRLEIEKDSSPRVKLLLKEMLSVEEEDIYEFSGPIDVSSFMKIATMDGFEEAKFKKFTPCPIPELMDEEIFDTLSEKDILLHHPFDTFDHVVDFLKHASEDPDVLAIKQTLYRVSGNSPIVEYLIRAAENGKQVTVLVELKARFDEENNIQWAKKLEKAGCYVVYGLVGLKTHCKVLLVVRREKYGIKRYVHLSTGNYNDSTAKLYTDIGMFTSNENYGYDASALFNVLTGYSLPPEWKKLSVAPTGLRAKFVELIETEIKNAKNGKEARIIIKCNSLLDKEIIEKLYEASASGVKIDLIIRGICAIKPGIEKISENIRVISIVGKYLEHSRIYYFHSNSDTKIFLSSADLMPRNLDRRIEILIPVESDDLKKELEIILDMCLKDTEKARMEDSNGNYGKIDKRGKKSFNVQNELGYRVEKKFNDFQEEGYSIMMKDMMITSLNSNDDDNDDDEGFEDFEVN